MSIFFSDFLSFYASCPSDRDGIVLIRPDSVHPERFGRNTLAGRDTLLRPVDEADVVWCRVAETSGGNLGGGECMELADMREGETVDVTHSVVHLIDGRAVRGLGGEATAEEGVGTAREVEGLDEIVGLVRAECGVSGVGGVATDQGVVPVMRVKKIIATAQRSDSYGE